MNPLSNMDIDKARAVNCQACGRQIDVQMRRCPGCGKWVRPFSTGGVPADRPAYERGSDPGADEHATAQEWVGDGAFIKRAQRLPRNAKRPGWKD